MFDYRALLKNQLSVDFLRIVQSTNVTLQNFLGSDANAYVNVMMLIRVSKNNGMKINKGNLFVYYEK